MYFFLAKISYPINSLSICIFPLAPYRSRQGEPKPCLPLLHEKYNYIHLMQFEENFLHCILFWSVYLILWLRYLGHRLHIRFLVAVGNPILFYVLLKLQWFFLAIFLAREWLVDSASRHFVHSFKFRISRAQAKNVVLLSQRYSCGTMLNCCAL